MKSTIFWDITPCSPLKLNLLFGGTSRPHLQDRRKNRARNQNKSRWQTKMEATWRVPSFGIWRCVVRLMSTDVSEEVCHLLSRWFLAQIIIFSSLNMETICFSKTSVDFQRITRGYIPEDGTLHNHRCENLKSYIKIRCLDCRIII
jgi:hypothetical protein